MTMAAKDSLETFLRRTSKNNLVMTEYHAMHPAYFDTRFRVEPGTAADDWPAELAIISAYPTTGQWWSDEENRAADVRLEMELRQRSISMRRVIGYSRKTGHAEPSWAAAVSFKDACDLGQKFKQDAIYYVKGDELSVSFCDYRRGLVPVGSFRERLRKSGEAEIK